MFYGGIGMPTNETADGSVSSPGDEGHRPWSEPSISVTFPLLLPLLPLPLPLLLL